MYHPLSQTIEMARVCHRKPESAMYEGRLVSDVAFQKIHMIGRLVGQHDSGWQDVSKIIKTTFVASYKQ